VPLTELRYEIELVSAVDRREGTNNGRLIAAAKVIELASLPLMGVNSWLGAATLALGTSVDMLAAASVRRGRPASTELE